MKKFYSFQGGWKFPASGARRLVTRKGTDVSVGPMGWSRGTSPVVINNLMRQ